MGLYGKGLEEEGAGSCSSEGDGPFVKEDGALGENGREVIVQGGKWFYEKVGK